jgi:hypothetical protein
MRSQMILVQHSVSLKLLVLLFFRLPATVTTGTNLLILALCEVTGGQWG